MYRKLEIPEVEQAVRNSSSYAQVLRELNRTPVGGNIDNLKRFVLKNCIDVSHFTGRGHNRGKRGQGRLPPSHHLKLGTSSDFRQKASVLTRCMLEEGLEYKCNKCGLTHWYDKPMTLEVDHIDECYWNNTLENLQFLCPNCHTMKNK